MADSKGGAERVTEIIALLEPERPRRLPETLTAAAAAGDLERMQLFLERGANLEERSVGFSSPLGAACAAGQLEAVRWLIARQAKLDPPGAVISPVQAAAGRGHSAVVGQLLDAGLPLDRAAWAVVAGAALGRLDIVRWLVGRGLALDRTYPGLGVLRDRAVQSARKDAGDELIRFLRGELDPGPAPSTPPPSPPAGQSKPRAAAGDRQALIDEASAAVRAAGRSAATWNAVGRFAPPQRQRLISFAAAAGVVDVVVAFLDGGAPLDPPMDGTPPPLAAAAGEAQLDVVTLLLERGARPDGPDGKAWIPLASAAQSGDPEVVQALLAAGANPRLKAPGGGKLADSARGPFAPEIRALLESAAAAKGGRKPRATRQTPAP
ncbi:MAG: ankyrin repeat domain-containing protein [Gemmatimonadales bacterium]|nr:ankyrin repeat domain-containing protein [Gemmatimonadales bacterium]